MSLVHQGQKWYESHRYNCKQQYKGFGVMKFGGKGEKKMPSSTYTKQMSKNSKIYKINNVNTPPSKIKYRNGPKSPTPNSEEAPPAKCPKGHPNEKMVQGKRASK